MTTPVISPEETDSVTAVINLTVQQTTPVIRTIKFGGGTGGGEKGDKGDTGDPGLVGSEGPPGGITSHFDTFDRPNGNINGVYNEIVGSGAITNGAVGPTIANDVFLVRQLLSKPSEIGAMFKINGATTSTVQKVTLGWGTGATQAAIASAAIVALVDRNTWQIYTQVSNVLTTRASGSFAVPLAKNGTLYSVQLRVVDNQSTLLLDGVELGQWTDPLVATYTQRGVWWQFGSPNLTTGDTVTLEEVYSNFKLSTLGTSGTALAAGQPVVSSAPGVATKFGRKRNDLVDRWKADPTGVRDSTDALVAALAASVAGDGPVETGNGTFKFTGSDRIVHLGGVRVIGTGADDKTKFKFTHINGGYDFGELGPVPGTTGTDAGFLGHGGGIEHVTFDGSDTTRNLMRWLNVSGWMMIDVELNNSGYDPADHDGSYAHRLIRPQNGVVIGYRCNNHKGNGVSMERGAGAIKWLRGRIGGMAKNNDTPTFPIVNLRAFATPGGTSQQGIDPFPRISKMKFEEFFIEKAKPGMDKLVQLDAAASWVCSFNVAGGKEIAAGQLITLMEFGEVYDMIMDGTILFGANELPGNVTGIRTVSTSARRIRFAGKPVEFDKMQTAMDLANGESVEIGVEPKFGAEVANHFVGTGGGVAKVIRAYTKRYNSADVSSDQNRGIQALEIPVATSVPDKLWAYRRGETGTAYGKQDMFTTGAAPTWVPEEWVFKDQLRTHEGSLYRKKASGLTGLTFNSSLWDSYKNAENSTTILTTGSAKTIPDGFDNYIYSLTAGAGATLTVPPAIIGSKLIELTNTSTGSRPYTFTSPTGSTLVGRPNNTVLTGTLAPGTSKFILLICNTDGKWFVSEAMSLATA